MKDTFYFPHDSNATVDPKIMIMLGQLGLEGYGIYWVIIETLRNQPGYRAPVAILKPLAMRYGASEEKFTTVVQNYELFIVDEHQFFSPSLTRRMEVFEQKRAQAKRAATARWGEKKKLDNQSVNAGALPEHYGSNASKVKESKVKESKVKEDKEINKEKPPPKLCLMKNSNVTIEDLKLAFEKSDELNQADPVHYFNAALDWSTGSSKMKADWIATTRNFARSDLREGKLKRKTGGGSLISEKIKQLENKGYA